MRCSTLFVGCAVIAPLVLGCASDRRSQEPASYQQLRQQELAAERQEFMADTETRLTEIDREIQRLQVKIEHEGQYASAPERADWTQELFELEQERNQLQAQLQHARNASPEEWEAMRGTIGSATDSLQAGVSKLGEEISSAVASSEPEQSPEAMPEPGLCPVEVSGVEAEVEQQKNQLVVLVTTDEDAHVPELRRRAREMAQQTMSYPPASSARSDASGSQSSAGSPSGSSTSGGTTETAGGVRASGSGDMSSSSQSGAESSGSTSGSSTDPGASSTEPVEVRVTVQDIEDGARLVFTPKNGNLELLRERLERDAEQLGKGRCEVSASPSAQVQPLSPAGRSGVTAENAP